MRQKRNKLSPKMKYCDAQFHPGHNQRQPQQRRYQPPHPGKPVSTPGCNTPIIWSYIKCYLFPQYVKPLSFNTVLAQKRKKKYFDSNRTQLLTFSNKLVDQLAKSTSFINSYLFLLKESIVSYQKSLNKNKTPNTEAETKAKINPKSPCQAQEKV